MRKIQLGWGGIVALAVIASAMAIQASPPTGEKTDTPVKLGVKSVTVFPIVITPNKDFTIDSRQRIGEVVGMMLERADMNVRLGKAEFLPKEGDKIDQVADAFGRFVVSQKIETPYALLGEILGERKKGVRAIRTIVVDDKGNVVFAEEVQKDAFARSAPTAPKDPMSCCVFMVHRLRKPWDLPDPFRKDAPRGKVQENWRKRSGVPTDKEIEAMKTRAVQLRKQLADSTLDVYPAGIGKASDAKAGADLAALLAGAGFSSVRAVEKGPDLNVPGSPNEQEVLWRTARKVRTYFQEHAPAGEYVLVADFGVGQTEQKMKVGAVHWILCDQRGDWVMVDYQNSHHNDFQKVDPDSIEDCLELVKVRVKKRLAAAN